LNCGDDAVVKVVREPSQILFSGAFEQYFIHVRIFSPLNNPPAGDSATVSAALA
jgi:hypothetical protein